MQNFFISLLAPLMVIAFLITSGALFQSLEESMLILSLAALDFAESLHFFVVPGLKHLSDPVLLRLFSSN